MNHYFTCICYIISGNVSFLFYSFLQTKAHHEVKYIKNFTFDPFYMTPQKSIVEVRDKPKNLYSRRPILCKFLLEDFGSGIVLAITSHVNSSLPFSSYSLLNNARTRKLTVRNHIS